MSGFFCGNPFNHDSHFVEDKATWCDGVGRVAVEDAVVVEKFVPELEGSDMAEDGTEYHKVTILIEHKNGDVVIVTAPKASYPRAEASVNPYIPLDKSSVEYYPEIEKVNFVFQPHTTDEGPAITIEKVKAPE